LDDVALWRTAQGRSKPSQNFSFGWLAAGQLASRNEDDCVEIANRRRISKLSNLTTLAAKRKLPTLTDLSCFFHQLAEYVQPKLLIGAPCAAPDTALKGRGGERRKKLTTHDTDDCKN
ncbi:unnamed protein product, partial [Pylaiella littoralis]